MVKKTLLGLLVFAALSPSGYLLTKEWLAVTTVGAAKHLEGAFEVVAAKAAQAVVVITARNRRAAIPSGDPYGEMLRQLFEERQAPDADSGKLGARGSGFIIRKDGYILTNHHVVKGNDDISVELINHKRYPAKLVGSDPKTDLAVLKIDAKEDLPALGFAAPENVKVGNWAIAIGAPFNLDYTVTVGIVSNIGRAVGMNIYENYIQTDASINPGNSGGPLLNLDGEVMGINDFILTSAGQGSIGLSFAVSSSLAKQVSEQLIESGEVVRPWLGIAMADMRREELESLGLPNGVRINGARPGQPADVAGVKAGDILLAIDGGKVRDNREAMLAIIKHRPGDKIALTVFRGGKTLKFDVVAARQDSLRPALASPPGGGIERVMAKHGLRLGEQNGELIIVDVGIGSSADQAGLRPGMAVYAVNNVNVGSLAALAMLPLRDGGKYLLLYVGDGEGKSFVALSSD